MGEVVTRHEVEAVRVREMKIQWLLAAGFSPDNAMRVADSDLDYHFAVDAMRHGLNKGYEEQYIVDLLI